MVGMNQDKIYIGDALTVLKTLPDESVHCCVTSPPYWGLRDYGLDPQIWDGDPACDHEWIDKTVERENRTGLGLSESSASTRGGGHKIAKVGWQRFTHGFCQKCGAWRGSFGLEPTPELYIKHAVDIFREVKRVLRNNGTLWLNMGDSYAAGGNGGHKKGAYFNGHTRRGGDFAGIPKTAPRGLKPKDLVGIPWMLAFALRADGWYLRSDIIWSKANPMPESATDRPTKSHEYIFLLSKSQRYFFDQEAVREPVSGTAHPRGNGVNPKAVPVAGWDNGKGRHDKLQGRYKKEPASAARLHTPKQNESFSASCNALVAFRNLRSVWTITTEPYKEAHFATFPLKLIEPCIKAGTSEKGCCPECGKPWVRQTEKIKSLSRKTNSPHAAVPGQPPHSLLSTERYDLPAQITTTGWQPTCGHGLDPSPCIVLDPFGGSGTTGRVARNLGRNFILIELNPAYVEMQINRTEDMFCQPRVINHAS